VKLGPSTQENLMKKQVLTLVCGMILCATSGYGLESPNDATSKKDCQLHGRGCPIQYRLDSLPERIQKLRLEIEKGGDVYTAGELKVLQAQLKQAGAALAALKRGGK
jgi:hypothetical protein